MHSLPIINNGYFFSFGLILRESLPKNETFYIIFFLFKFFPILLFTHGNYYQSSNLFTIKKIMKSLSLFNHNITDNYIYLSYFLYFILGFIIISIPVLIIIIKRNEKQKDIVVSIKKKKKKTIDLLIKLINYVLLSCLFVYHYICEILYFGFFKAFFNNLVKKSNLKEITVDSLSIQHYVIGVVSVIYFIFIIIIMCQFFFLVSKQTPINYHGFKSSFSKTQKFIYTILFSTQGIYSSLSLLKEEKQIEVGIYISIIFAIILFINSLVLINRVNFYSLSKVDIFFKYFSNFCIASTITGLIVYYFGNEKSIQTQKFYLLILAIDILNGITFTKVMDYIQQKVFLNRLSKECFTFDKLLDPRILLQFYLFFIKSKKIHEKFLYIIKLINQHQKKCNNNEKCLSKEIKQKLVSSTNPYQLEKLVIKFMSYIEFQISKNFTEQVQEDKKKISPLLILHCDYLLSLKRLHLPHLIYICQYYLFNKQAYLTPQDSYLLYELNAELFSQMNKLNKDNSNVSLLEENYQFQKIQKIMEDTLTNVEKIFQYKAAKHTNSSMIYSCENILESSKNFNQNNKRLINLVSLYDNKNLIQHFLELKYLLLFYIKLFQVVVPKNLLQKISINPEKDIENELLEALDNIDASNKFIIISLNKDNKFSISHVSLELGEILGHSMKEIQGKDFHETFLPQHIRGFHEIYMKNYIFFGNSYKKKSFILKKKNQLVPIYVYCKIFPTFNSFFSIIIHVNYIKQNNYLQYDALLNENYNFFAMSQSFEKRFSISLKILNTLKLNFFSFFGLNLEKVDGFFKIEKQKLNKDKNLFKKKNASFFPLTTIKKNEIYYYENIDFSSFMNMNYSSNISKSFCLEKDKIMKGIEKLKTLEMDNNFDTYIWKKSNSTSSLRIIDQPSEYSKIYTLKQIDHLFAQSNFFKVTFQLKSIGNLFYYLATIIETLDEQNLTLIPTKLKANYSSNLYDPFDARLEIDGLLGTDNYHNYSKEQTGVEETGFLGSSNNSLYRIKENSELSFLNNQSNSAYSRVSSLFSILKPTKTPVAHFFKDKDIEPEKPEPKISSIQLIKVIEFTRVCKISIFTCCFIVVLLNIINVALNNSMLDSSLGLFYINTYSFLLTNDIFYGSVASLGTCFIKDKIQTGDIENLIFRVNQSSNDLIEHFYLLNFYTNKIITRTESKIIYDILQGEELYSVLSDNWENIDRNSTLVQEIYVFFHYLKLFEINKDSEENNCKIREIYIDKIYGKYNTEDKIPSPTKEEKLIYYICKNVVSNISVRLEKLMREANILLNLNNKSAKWLSVSIIISIFSVSFIIFVISLISIWKLTYSLSGYIILLFQKRDKEELLFDEIILLKKLVNDFSVKDCINFSSFRLRFYANASNQKEKIKTIKSKFEDKTKKKFGSVKNMVKISSTKSNGPKQSKEAIIQKNKNFIANFSQKTKPKFSFWGYFSLSLTFIIFAAFEISTIMITLNSYDRLIKENNFGTNFLSRGPKINELFLYSIISVLMNDIFYFTTKPELFNSGVFSNNYQITLNLNESSKFTNFKNSNFIYLYYQIYIIRNNINKFISDKKVNNYLRVTLDNENHCNSGEDFCLVVTREYLNQYYSSGLSPLIFFEKLNKEASQCSRIGNGINKSGYKTALDVMMQQLVNKYDNFYKSKLSTKQISFLQDNNILIIQNNVVNVLRALHFVDSFSVIKDIKNSYLQNYNKKIVFSAVSIALTLAIIFLVYLTFLFKFLYYINIMQEVICIFDNIAFNSKTPA